MPQYKYTHCQILISLVLILSSAGTVAAGSAVWIDSDPACNQARTNDVDDCWALLLALGSQTLDIRGISSVFGNSSEELSYTTATSLLQKFDFSNAAPSVYRGAVVPLGSSSPNTNPAVEALAAALEKEALTIIALGPLTNIASLVINHPDRIANIKQVIVVAGQRPDKKLGFYPGKSKLFHVHDFNFRKDVRAVDTILSSPIPVALVPFEVAQVINIDEYDLTQMKQGGYQARWLGEISAPWLGLWQQDFQATGFHPFDSLAIGFASNPELFSCESIPAKIEHKQSLFMNSRDKLVVSHEYSEQNLVRYCYAVDPFFKSHMLEILR
jgi:pyrimidine-specific ribonucleoside hydrolase